MPAQAKIAAIDATSSNAAAVVHAGTRGSQRTAAHAVDVLANASSAHAIVVFV